MIGSIENRLSCRGDRIMSRFFVCFLVCLALLVLLLLAVQKACAQTYKDRLGTVVQGQVEVPFPYTPMAPGQYSLAIASSTALTPPTGARYAAVCADGHDLRYTTDGATTPTTSKGVYLANGTCVALVGSATITSFRAITTTSGGTLDAEYFQ